MDYTNDEEKFILWLEKALLAKRGWIPHSAMLQELGFTEEQWGAVHIVLWSQGMYDTGHIDGGVKAWDPLQKCVDAAREIRKRREERSKPVDIVATFESWCRSKWFVAIPIIAVVVLGSAYGVITLVRDIIGLFRK